MSCWAVLDPQPSVLHQRLEFQIDSEHDEIAAHLPQADALDAWPPNVRKLRRVMVEPDGRGAVALAQGSGPNIQGLLPY